MEIQAAKSLGIDELEKKVKIARANPHYMCRHHPTNGWHQVGCSHIKWTVEQLQDALENANAVNRVYQNELFGLPLDGNSVVVDNSQKESHV